MQVASSEIEEMNLFLFQELTKIKKRIGQFKNDIGNIEDPHSVAFSEGKE